jgi:hypothetical protein
MDIERYSVPLKQVKGYTIALSGCVSSRDEMICLLIDFANPHSQIYGHVQVDPGDAPGEFLIQTDSPERVKEIVDILKEARYMNEPI